MAGAIGCWHIGIHVADIERSIRFYTEVFGFRLFMRRESTETYARTLCGYPAATLQQAMLTFPGDDSPPGTGVFFEIFEYQSVVKFPVDTQPANPGTAHFCLRVDDLEALYPELAAKGVQFISGVITQTGGVNKGGRVVYAKDPDGIIIELIQLVRYPMVIPSNVNR